MPSSVDTAYAFEFIGIPETICTKTAVLVNYFTTIVFIVTKRKNNVFSSMRVDVNRKKDLDSNRLIKLKL